jgi:hypothetical protein
MEVFFKGGVTLKILLGLCLLVLGTAGVILFWVLRWKPERLEKEHGIIVVAINTILAFLAINRFTLGLFFLIMGIFGLCMLIVEI